MTPHGSSDPDDLITMTREQLDGMLEAANEHAVDEYLKTKSCFGLVACFL